jgi:hypothetical protein
MKKLAILTLSAILAIAMTLTLTACGDNTSPASTPEPTPEATPTPTPEPTPELCQHDWLAAACDDPETCSICEETQGAPLGHDWKAANFQEPQICLLCDEIGGEPLTPGAITYNLDLITALGVAQGYSTRTGRNNMMVSALLTLTDVSVADEYDGHESEEGYEFLIAEFLLSISSENARNYGFSYLDILIDYYTYDPVLLTEVDDAESNNPMFTMGHMNYYGEDSDFIAFNTRFGGWGGPSSYRVFTMTLTYAVHVPIDYDGAIIAFASTRFLTNHEESIGNPDDFDAIEWLTTQTARDVFSFDTLYFRLRG